VITEVQIKKEDKKNFASRIRVSENLRRSAKKYGAGGAHRILSSKKEVTNGCATTRYDGIDEASKGYSQLSRHLPKLETENPNHFKPLIPEKGKY
jgi:hypothetical protein